MPTHKVDLAQTRPLRMRIQAGVEELERGEFTEVRDADLDRYLENLDGQIRKPA